MEGQGRPVGGGGCVESRPPFDFGFQVEDDLG